MGRISSGTCISRSSGVASRTQRAEKTSENTGGGGDLTLHALGVSGTIGRADKDAGTEAETVDEEDGQRHQRVGGADGGKGVFADKFAHDDAVGGVISELEQVAQHQRMVNLTRRGVMAPVVMSFVMDSFSFPFYSMFWRALNTASAERLLPFAISWAAA